VRVEIQATGIRIRAATDAELNAYRRSRLCDELDLPGSYRFLESPVAAEGQYVVAQSFVEFRRDGEAERWDGTEYHGRTVPADGAATSALLAVAREAREDLTDLLGDMGIAGMHVTRWALLSAPHRIELDAALRERLSLR
jgi:hypothetical protein